MLTAIRQWVVRTMMKSKGETGIVKTLPSKDLIELNTQVTAQRLMQNGVDPTQLKNADQVENVINQIERSNTQVISQGDPRFQGIMDQLMGGKKSAKVFDMEGKRIDPKKGIMGGKQVDNDLPPPGSRGGPDDIAAPVQSADESLRNVTETEAEILARINKENKKGIESLKQKMRKEKARTQRISGNLRADNANRTEIGKPKLDEDEYDYYREILGEDPEVDYYPVKGDETKEFLEAMVKEQKDEMDYMKRLYDKGALDPPEDFAQGGRAGFKSGLGMKFLKFLNENNPVQAYKKYLKSVKDRMKAGKEAEVAGEVIPIAAGGALITNQLKKKLKAMNEEQKKKIEKEAQEELRKDMKKADGGRAGFKNGVTAEELKRRQNEARTAEEIKRMRDEETRRKINQYFNIEGEFKKPGKKQLKGAPEGVTIDRETYNFLINARIPVSEKVDLLTRFGQEKFRDRLEFDDQELFLGERGSRQREIGAGINLDAKKGLSGSIMYDPDTGRKTAGIKYTFNQGGRVGLKNGMSRRKFMQIMGGLAAIPIVGKFFKAGKVATKAAPIVKTPPVPGKPKWFDALVNKVISEGDDVTKQLATKEREIVHTVKLTDEPKVGYVSAQNDQVTVYRDLDDGTVRVEYNSVDNMSEAPVNLTFKPGMADETTKVKPADTFQADEIVPESRMVGPDDFEIEEAVDEFDNVVDLSSDVSKLKEFAGEKLTTKEIVEGINKRKKSKAITEDRGEAADFMTSRQGDYDPSGDEFASGGIARMLGE